MRRGPLRQSLEPTPQLMGSLPKGRRNARTFTDKTTKRIQEIKNGLVLQVATKQGTFWKEVRKTRARWGIRAPTQLPPANADLLYPERLLRLKAENAEDYVYGSHNWDRDLRRLWLWLAVPSLERYREEIDWRPFMSALVLYQPPLNTLQEFAKYGGIVPKTPEYKREEPTTSHDPMLVEPLVHRLAHPYAVEWECESYYETLMKEINERFLKPQGLDIDELRAEILQDGTLEESLQERLTHVPRHLYVEVPEEPSVDELRKAVELAASMREEREEARKPSIKASKSLLMQVEIAYRHYRLGEGYPDVVERYRPNVGSAETFKRYARIGRAYLPEDR